MTHVVRLASRLHMAAHYRRSPTKRSILPSLARTSEGGRPVFMAAHRENGVVSVQLDELRDIVALPLSVLVSHGRW